MLGYSRDHFDLEWFPQGFYLVEQGETAEKLYLILSGEADVVQELDDGTLKVVGHVSPGNFFGEEGLAYRQPRNAHVIARQDVTCLVFSPEEPTLFAGRGEESQLTATCWLAAEIMAARHIALIFPITLSRKSPQWTRIVPNFLLIKICSPWR